MLRKSVGVILVLACVVYAQISFSQGEGELLENPHQNFIQTYEGTKTCLTCHAEQAEGVFHSIHYQWTAEAPNIVNADGQKLGKIITTNDFCTNPAINWIGILKNSKDQVISNGCSKCHVGLGLKPSAEKSQEQLENIDCLICHSNSYKRQVYKTEEGALRWRPVAYDQPEVLLNIVQNVTNPTKEMCLKCHATSGGGPNYKRGDIEPQHAKADREFDVHIGSGMNCTQCHTVENHRIAGSGTQLAGQDRPGETVGCENCHSGAIHENAKLNDHTDTVYCTSCHIPSFAKAQATDMHRDWSQHEYLEAKDKYEPLIRFEKNVKPVYTWWNGKGKLALLKEPVELTDGKVRMYNPQGSIDDPESKIYAFKLHTGKLPIDSETKEMIPIKVGVVFKTSNNDAAVKKGAEAFLGKVPEYEWVDVERYLGIFHEVVPKEQALQCASCHMDGDRMNWEALGYAGDPMTAGGRKLE